MDDLGLFERFVRTSVNLTYVEPERVVSVHPFDGRNIHPKLPHNVRALFDDGHFSQATFEAFKYVDKEVSRLGGSQESGEKLMMAAFNETSPLLSLTPRTTTSQKDEQRGYRFLFAGSAVAIRNPRGHEYTIRDTPDERLDHLGLASTLLRRLEAAGFNLIEAFN